MRRITDEERVISGGRMIFSYQVPYFYKNEAGLLYVEPQNDQTVGVLKRRKEEEWDGDEDDVAAEEQELEEREDAPGSEVRVRPFMLLLGGNLKLHLWKGVK